MQALGGGVGRGAVDKPKEEGAGEGGGVIIVVTDSTAEFAELVLILAGALFYGTVTFENSTTSV
jgi:hypothetical protein